MEEERLKSHVEALLVACGLRQLLGRLHDRGQVLSAHGEDDIQHALGGRELRLRQHLSKRFAKWQIPDAFVFVEEIPHTSTGKMAKTVLRTRYADWSWDGDS